MAYLSRGLESKINSLRGRFPSILVTGPRQSGKTSMLMHLAQEVVGNGVQHFSFDTPSEADLFRRDPDLFFENHPGILFLDEIQHVPDIFPYLKREIDKTGRGFRFFLSGSQQFALMKGVSESLAGRVAILDLWPLARLEIAGRCDGGVVRFLQDPHSLASLSGSEFPLDDDAVLNGMIEGGYPPVVLQGGGKDWLEAYRRTYLQRDLRDLSQVGDLGRFDRFLVLSAGRTATILNKAEIAATMGVSNKTIDHWLSLLETSYQMIHLHAYHLNTTKRLVKRPKYVFADSGLGLHLQAIRTHEALIGAPHFGHLFESFVIMEIRKLFGHAGEPWDACFWRTPAGLECDLVLMTEGRLIPVEIKHAASVSQSQLSPLESFLDLYPRIAPMGIVVSMNPRVERLSRRVYNVPLGMLIHGLPRAAA